MGYLIGELRYRWPAGGIPYRIDSSIDSHPKAAGTLAGAINTWNQTSPLALVPDTGKKAADYVRFVAGPSGKGGLSAVGRVGGRQDVVMDYDWPEAPVALLHEIGHAAGIIHEHQRPDRDQHVDVKPIPATDARAKGNVDIAQGGVPVGSYDCRSLMHYDATDPYVDPKPSSPFGGCTQISNDTGLSSGDLRVLAHLAGTRYEVMAEDTFGKTLSHFVRFQLGFGEFLVPYSSSTGSVSFCKVGQDARLSVLSTGSWKEGWDALAVVDAGNDRLLVAYDAADGQVRMDRVLADGSGSSNTWDAQWSPGWDAVLAVGATSEARDHILVYDSQSGTVRLDKIKSDGTGTVNRWEQQWTKGMHVLRPFRLGVSDWRVLAYDHSTGRAEIHRISPHASSVAGTYGWAPGWTEFAFHPPYARGYDSYVRCVAYNSSTGDVHFGRMSEPGWEIEVASTWAAGWSSLVPVFLGLHSWGNVGIIVNRQSDGLTHFDRLY